MPAESDLIPYAAVAEIPARAAVVLAPHADDEVFGCGGAIAAHARAGVPVRVIVLTDGAARGEAADRPGESMAAAQLLGYGTPEFWTYPDRGLRCDEETVERVAAAVRASDADLLYAPSPWEVHPDHRQAAAIAAQVARRTGVRVAFYEVGSPLRPNLLVDITASAATKDRAMQCFQSQLEHQEYASQIRALNHYRSYTLPRAVAAAEAFLLLDATELDGALAGALAAVPASLGGSASPAAADARPPLVSVLIRSLDREHLAEALDSVALQTYPNIEVVVIAAAPGHRDLPPRCGRFPLRLVATDVPLPRSRAANKALDEARGDYLLFLDDDDWLMPAHVARLAAVLRKQPYTCAVYAGVAMVGPDGAPLGQVFDLPFDGVRQLAGNLTPIHAVLFRKQAVANGCRFDETLDRYEDWDFWLQVARQAPMVHLPGVSAAYRVHQSSGVHEEAGPEAAATQVVYRKWQDQWSAGEAAALMQRAWACATLEEVLAATRHLVAELQKLLAEHADTIREQSRLSAEHAQELVRQLQEQARLIGEQARTIDEQRRMIDDQSHTVANQSHTIARQADEHAHALAQQRQAADQLRALAEMRQRQIDAFVHSTSWRLTAPLRWLSSRLRRRP